ncbi:MAG: coproporphyrinogen III oxidase, partial [Xanthomonadales bacterium]|nr:coproporphyrinogen III oxidase [Xanthomonadales bacterium]
VSLLTLQRKYAQALAQLSTAGYQWVGMDHFAKHDAALAASLGKAAPQRHAQDHSPAGLCDVIGLGVGAISRIGDSYSQNMPDLRAYVGALDHAALPVARGVVLEEDDVIRHDLIDSLIRYGSVDTQAFAQRHQLDFCLYFAASLDALQPYVSEGLVHYRDGIIDVTAHGRLVLRYIAMCFDAYARSKALAGLQQRDGCCG